LGSGPQLCMASAGGSRIISIEGNDVARVISPYEIEFLLVNASANTQNRRPMIGLFSELNPVGNISHVVDPTVPLGSDSFACVASELMVAGSGRPAVRAFDVTYLAPEQVLYALMTLHARTSNIQLGFALGAGGSTDDAKAALSAMSFLKTKVPIHFSKQLPGRATIDEINEVRSLVLQNLTDTRKDFHGDGVLLWQDNDAIEALQRLIARISLATPREPDRDGRRTLAPLRWVRYKEPRKQGSEAQADDDDDDDDVDSMDIVDSAAIDWDIKSLEPLGMPRDLEQQVAQKASKEFRGFEHNFECPDCGERFRHWESCLKHYEKTCHLDVSSPTAIEEAKKLSRPVRYSCLECGEPFTDWPRCLEHLRATGHLSWLGAKLQRTLCIPQQFEDEDEDDWEDDDDEVGGGSSSSKEASIKRDLVEQVNKVRRKHKKGYNSYIMKAAGTTTKDPKRHSVEILRGFLEGVSSGSIPKDKDRGGDDGRDDRRDSGGDDLRRGDGPDDQRAGGRLGPSMSSPSPPNPRTSEIVRVYLSHLPDDMEADELQAIAGDHGTVLAHELRVEAQGNYKSGWVEYATRLEGEACVHELHRRWLEDWGMPLQAHLGPPDGGT